VLFFDTSTTVTVYNETDLLPTREAQKYFASRTLEAPHASCSAHAALDASCSASSLPKLFLGHCASCPSRSVLGFACARAPLI
jgi:hypothetical protein